MIVAYVTSALAQKCCETLIWLFYSDVSTSQSIKLRFQLMSAQPIAKMHAESEIQAWKCTDGHLLQPQPQQGK